MRLRNPPAKPGAEGKPAAIHRPCPCNKQRCTRRTGEQDPTAGKCQVNDTLTASRSFGASISKSAASAKPNIPAKMIGGNDSR